MPTITTAQAGNWSSGSTWVGGSVPADGDTVVIDHNVVFDVNQSAWVTGLLGVNLIKEGCTLSISATTNTHMRLGTTGRWAAKQAATFANPARFRCGNSLADGLPIGVTFTLYSFCNVSRNALFTSDYTRATYGILDVVCVDGYPRPIRFATVQTATATTTLDIRLHNTTNTPLSLSVGETIFISNGTARTAFIERQVTAIVNNNNGTMRLTLSSVPGFTISKGALIAVTTSNVVIEHDVKTGTNERIVFGGMINAALRCLIKGTDIAIDSAFANNGGHASGNVFEGWVQQSRWPFRGGSGYLIRNGGGHGDLFGFNGGEKCNRVESAAFVCPTFIPQNDVWGQTQITDNEYGQATILVGAYQFNGQTLHPENGSVVVSGSICFTQFNRQLPGGNHNKVSSPIVRFKSMHWIESFLTAGFGFQICVDSSGQYNSYRGVIEIAELTLDYASGTPFLGPSTVNQSLQYGDAGERGVQRFQASNITRITGPTVSGTHWIQNRYGSIKPDATPPNSDSSLSKAVFAHPTGYPVEGYLVALKEVYAGSSNRLLASVYVKMDTLFTKQRWSLAIIDATTGSVLDLGDNIVPGVTGQFIARQTALANTNGQWLSIGAKVPRDGRYLVAVFGASDSGHVGWVSELYARVLGDDYSIITDQLADLPYYVTEQFRGDADYGTDGLLAKIDETISSRLAAADYVSPPSESDIAGEVRVNLTTELLRIDMPISESLEPVGELANELALVKTVAENAAMDAAIAADNSVAIKAKTEQLTTERFAKIDSIGTGEVGVISPMALDGTILGPILVGDDYTAADRDFEWSIDPRGYPINEASMVFAGTNGQTGWRVAKTPVLESGKWVGRFTMRRSTEFATIKPNTTYDYSVAIVGPVGWGEETIARGTVKAIKQHTRL